MLTSTGRVAFGVVSLWYIGIPNSSSHTLTGSIIGVGLMNQILEAKSGVSGVDWSEALNVDRSLLFSPIIGFVFSVLLLFIMKRVIHNRKLYKEPEGTEPPPFWIRALLFFYLHRCELRARL